MNQREMITKRRLELGLSQQDVAIELGMHVRQYQRYEYGEQDLSKCAFATGLRLCSVLGLNPYDVVSFEGCGPVRK